MPKFYLNLKSYRKSLSTNSNPYTPAVNLIFALDEALKMMREEGLDNIFLRHEKHKKAISNAAKALNLKLFADENIKSFNYSINTDEINAEEFRKTIKISLIFY